MTANDNDHRGLLPAGLADLLPPDAAREARAIDVAIERFAAFGYERVKPPLVEFEESLLGGPGAALGPQTFRLMDPCLLYTSPSPRDGLLSRMPSSA